MLAARRKLIVLAALVAAAHAEECSSTTIGPKTAYSIKLPDVKMPPGVKHINVEPVDECPVPSIKVGLFVKACDQDVAPALYMYNLNVAVNRLGSAAAEGRIESTLYCDGPLQGGYMLQPQPYLAPTWPRMSKEHEARYVYNAPNAYNAYSGSANVYDPHYHHRGFDAHAHEDSHEHGLGAHYPYVPGVAVKALHPHKYAAVLPLIYPLHHK